MVLKNSVFNNLRKLIKSTYDCTVQFNKIINTLPDRLQFTDSVDITFPGSITVVNRDCVVTINKSDLSRNVIVGEEPIDLNEDVIINSDASYIVTCQRLEDESDVKHYFILYGDTIRSFLNGVIGKPESEYSKYHWQIQTVKGMSDLCKLMDKTND